MKRCTNPNCEGVFLFENEKTICPFCHNPLTEIDNSENYLDGITPADMITITDSGYQENKTVNFISNNNKTMECHGRIIEIDTHEVFMSKIHKLMNSLFRNEPYQFSHQIAEYTIRVENITDGVSTEVTDFCLYGNYLGRLQVGDEVFIKAKKRKDRRLVKSIYNETTLSAIKPGLQLSAGFVKGAVFLMLIILFFMIGWTIWFFKSGTALVLLSSFISAIMPVIIICFGVWYVLFSLFSRRR